MTPPLVWVELVSPSFWLETDDVKDIVDAWCSWSSGMSPKVGCSDPSAMVDKV
jgi:hypothetical protein